MRRITGGLSAAILIVLVAGCSVDGDARTAPTASVSASSPSETPVSPEPSEPSATPAPTEPAVAPATGPELSSDILTLRAPDGYSDDFTSTAEGALTAQFPDIQNFVQLEVSNTAGGFSEGDIDGMALAALARPITGVPMERFPDVVVDGQPAYQVAGPDPAFDGWRHEFGFLYESYTIKIVVNSLLDTPQEERDARNASIIASAQLLK